MLEKMVRRPSPKNNPGAKASSKPLLAYGYGGWYHLCLELKAGKTGDMPE
jgi:hypothetical protein